MKSKKVYVYAGIVLLVLSAALVWIGKNREQKPTDAKSEIAQSKSQLQPKPQGKIADWEVPVPSGNSPELQQGLQSSTSAQIVRTEVQVEEVLTDIENAAISYDAEELPILESYLYDPDPEIRAAALDGMLMLGDGKASPLLRTAAENAYTPYEAVAMLEAADFLDLPEMKVLPITKSTSGTGQKKSVRAELQKSGRFGGMMGKSLESSPSSKEPSPTP